MNGKSNMAFGFFYLLFTMVFGLYLADRAGIGSIEAVYSATQRTILASALLTSNIDAILNILVGYLLLRLSLMNRVTKVASISLLAGTVLHSGMLYLSGLGIIPGAIHFAPLGVFMMIVSMFVMGVGVFSLKTAK